jgi:Holliday junction resolvasome RuvABC endonuclease subunit
LGVDLSLTSTGWGLWTEHGLEAHGRLLSKKTGIARLQDLRDQLWSLVTFRRPTHWAVEGYSYGSKNTRQHAIGEWGGVAKLVLEERLPGKGYIISPSSNKKFITGSHIAKKPEMVLSLYKRWGVEVTQEDEADGVGLAITLHAFLRGPEIASELTAYQRDALGWEKAKKKVTPVELAA